TKKISAYDMDCQQHLIDNGMYLDNRDGLPRNFEEINKRLARARQSLSPKKFTDSEFERFRQLNDTAIGESKVVSTILQTMLGKAEIASEENMVFNNLKPMTDGSLVDAKPDIYDGAAPESLDPGTRKELAPYIVPSKHAHAPMLPNFSVEAKSSDGSPAVARRQAAINAHIGTRAMKSIQDFTDGTDTFDKNVRSYTSTLVDGHLKLYASHVTKSRSRSRPVDYHLTQLRSFSLTDSKSRFIEGITALRNSRDLAKEERDKAIALANSKVVELQ
ncbi:hypothetical protein F5884DRAFT_646690, partial [Xylogone sp. PMI_703]